MTKSKAERWIEEALLPYLEKWAAEYTALRSTLPIGEQVRLGEKYNVITGFINEHREEWSDG